MFVLLNNPCHKKNDNVRYVDDKLEREFHDNVEYLIRNYLEPNEKIKFPCNFECVVGLNKHDGSFLIGEFFFYAIEFFYINNHGLLVRNILRLNY